MFKVILLNDDKTTMDFVVFVLKEVFNKTQEAAVEITLKIHHEGSGVAGIFIEEVAETKTATVKDLAAANNFPLKVIMEGED
mgnify:CR=1 FL=1